MKSFARITLISSLAFMAAVGNDVYAEVEKSSDITWYSPVALVGGLWFVMDFCAWRGWRVGRALRRSGNYDTIS